MRLRAKEHHRWNIEDEILSEFRYVPVGARRNVEEHGTCFSSLVLTRGFGTNPIRTKNRQDSNCPAVSQNGDGARADVEQEISSGLFCWSGCGISLLHGHLPIHR